MTDARTLLGCSRGCADTPAGVWISIENSHGRGHPRSMNYGKRVSTRGRCPTGVPAERCSSHSGWARPGPSKAIRKPSPRRVHLPATEPRNSLRTMTWCCCSSSPHFRSPHLCCLLCRVDDIGEKNCCQNAIRLGAMTNPREKFLDLIEQRVNRPIR